MRMRRTHTSPGLANTDSSLLSHALKSLLLICCWYVLSTTLGMFNKKLVGQRGVLGLGPFPAPLLMSGMQFVMQTFMAKIVFYSRVMERTGKGPLSWRDYMHGVVPNGCTTGLDVGLSNLSLVYISMSFYTMCKSTVPVFLLVFAFIWRIERPSWALVGVVVIISTGLALLVMGETAFNAKGFIIVMTAACLSGFRFTLTQVFLQGHDAAGALGGPLEMVEQLTPVMAATVLLFSAVFEQLGERLPASPYFSSLEQTAITIGIIGLGASLAFMMVWMEYKVIQLTSSLTFMIAGTVKEIITVITAMIVLGDELTTINTLGLGVVICGVCLFNYHKYTRHKHAAARKVAGAEGRMEMEPLVIASSSSNTPNP